jgi:hypothetical protein
MKQSEIIRRLEEIKIAGHCATDHSKPCVDTVYRGIDRLLKDLKAEVKEGEDG